MVRGELPRVYCWSLLALRFFSGRADPKIKDLTMPKSNLPAPRPMLRWKDIHALLKRSRTQIWRDEKAGKFPKRVRTGPNSVAWYADEIAKHQTALARVAE